MNNTMLCFAKVHPNATIPSKRSGDAGYDLYACFDSEHFVIEPHTSRLVPTGIASAFSDEYVFVLEERGSTGVKSMKRGAGVVDSNFRGEIFFCLYNGNDKTVIITKETNDSVLELLSQDYIVYPYTKAICQGLLLPVPKVDIIELGYEELKSISSERGEGALGSSGK